MDLPDRGQAMVEFGLVAPLFFLMIFAVIQFGMILASNEGLNNAAREAARYASTDPVFSTSQAGTSCGGGVAQTAYNQLISAISRSVVPYDPTRVVACNGSPPAKATTVTYCLQTNLDGTLSVRVQVRASYREPLFIPLVGNIVDGLDGTNDNALLLTASESMRVETPNLPTTQLGGLPTCP